MTAPLFFSALVWCLPPVKAASALLIARKLTWTRQPALLCFLVTEVWVELLTLQHWLTREYAILAQLIAGAFLLAEMARLNRIPLHPRVQASVSVIAAAVCCFLVGSCPWTMDYQFSLLRSDLRIARAAAAIAIVAYRWRYPAFEHHAESRRNRVYRFGVTAWLITEAIQGAYVKGGLLMWLLPYTPERWTWVGISTCSAVLVVVVATALAMHEVAPGRKHAAKTPKGLTRTGLIESERAA